MAADGHVRASKRPRAWLNGLLAMDSRIKIALAIVFSVLVWRTGTIGLAIYGLGFGWLLYRLDFQASASRGLVKSCLLFILVWSAVKLAADVTGGAGFRAAMLESGLMGLRLLVLVFAGFTLAISTSRRDLGLALAWAARPVLGRRAWQSALALALMIHFLPLSRRTMQTVRTALRLRTGRMTWRTRVRVFVQAVLRNMSLKAWNQSLALAVRGLDRPEAWRVSFPRRPMDVWFGLAAAAAALALSAL